MFTPSPKFTARGSPANFLRLLRSLSTPAVTLNENSCYRSPTRSAMAQTARHPSVDITDTTPAHIAAALRPGRHHTRGLSPEHLHLGLAPLRGAYAATFLHELLPPWAAYESANYSLAHAPYMSLCAKLSGVAWHVSAARRWFVLF